MQYFEAVVRFDKTQQDGIIKTVREKHLVDAMSFTEAEKRITEEMKPFISGDFSVFSLRRKNYTEIVGENWSINHVDAEANKILGVNRNQSQEADRWFECKVNFVTLDEEKGVEKRTPNFMLVHANSTRAANDTLTQHMKGTLADYEIEKIAETKIMEVYHYQATETV